MGASVWSARPDKFRDFPARFIIHFYDNHGMLAVKGQPIWKTIPDGSRKYAQALLSPLAEKIRLECPVTSVVREEGSAQVTTATGQTENFDAVVLAAHSDQTLGMLADASESEREILGAIPYQRNEAIVHTDFSLLPTRRRAWASWNSCIPMEEDRPVILTYNLSRLQRHDSPEPLCLTLNRPEAIDSEKILRRIEYSHPVYSNEALAAQQRYDEINGKRNTFFCGAYWGYGFHEDGVKSALAVGKYFGKDLDTCTVAST
jgi:predicted NAD/FAD-binding protein